jgi:hypothetical protein
MRGNSPPRVSVCPFLAADFTHIESEFDWSVLAILLSIYYVDSGDLSCYFHSNILLGVGDCKLKVAADLNDNADYKL